MPVTERVNPHYANPPATPEDLVTLQNQIVDTLADRDQETQFARLMAAQAAHHGANEKPVTDVQKVNADAQAATQAHQRAIAHRDEANQRKQAEEGKVGARLEDYASRAAKLGVLTGPLKALAGFTGLVASLPDDPDFVRNFKRNILKVNGDARNFLAQINQMDQAVAAQKAEQARRQQAVAADAATLKQTQGAAKQSADTFEATQATTDDFAAKNTERKEIAKTDGGASQASAAKLEGQAKQKQGQAVSLAAAMKFWALNHRQARANALQATVKKLQGEGYRVTEVREK